MSRACNHLAWHRIAAFALLLACGAASCTGDGDRDGEETPVPREVERLGARCQDVAFEPDGAGNVSVEGISFVIPNGFRAEGCNTESPAFEPRKNEWLWLYYGSVHDEWNHTVLVAAGVWELDPSLSQEITLERRAEAIQQLRDIEVDRTRADPLFQDVSEVQTDISIPGLNCASYQIVMQHMGAQSAEQGQGWPMENIGIWCFDAVEPPTRVAHLFWSERHPPSIAGMPAEQVARQSRDFLTSLKFLPGRPIR
jgi:hypothetical protein